MLEAELGHMFVMASFHDDVTIMKHFPQYRALCDGNPPVDSYYPMVT